ncbi:MAG: hypothetical protein IIA66_07415 [Planctomycetes bacterium]|nr:hypothetical protein [Planctomycetota bacterium]
MKSTAGRTTRFGSRGVKRCLCGAAVFLSFAACGPRVTIRENGLLVETNGQRIVVERRTSEASRHAPLPGRDETGAAIPVPNEDANLDALAGDSLSRIRERRRADTATLREELARLRQQVRESKNQHRRVLDHTRVLNEQVVAYPEELLVLGDEVQQDRDARSQLRLQRQSLEDQIQGLQDGLRLLRGQSRQEEQRLAQLHDLVGGATPIPIEGGTYEITPSPSPAPTGHLEESATPTSGPGDDGGAGRAVSQDSTAVPDGGDGDGEQHDADIHWLPLWPTGATVIGVIAVVLWLVIRRRRAVLAVELDASEGDAHRHLRVVLEPGEGVSLQDDKARPMPVALLAGAPALVIHRGSLQVDPGDASVATECNGEQVTTRQLVTEGDVLRVAGDGDKSADRTVVVTGICPARYMCPDDVVVQTEIPAGPVGLSTAARS